MSLFPDVPNLPGVPQLLRDPAGLARSYVEQDVFNFVSPYLGAARNLAGIVTGDITGLLGTGDDLGANASQVTNWGLFFSDNGGQALFPDSFLGVELRVSSRISNYPLEKGAFETYNKVADPFEIVVGMTKGGDIIGRTNFLADVALIADGLARFVLVTPEQIFQSVNCERYDYKRTAHNGATLLTVNLYFKEVRVNTQSEFTSQGDDATTTEEAAQGTTAATVDSGAEVAPLASTDVQNPASASLQSLGQVQALAASARQASAAVNALTALPEGYVQSFATGAVSNLKGVIQSSLTIQLGPNFLG